MVFDTWSEHTLKNAVVIVCLYKHQSGRLNLEDRADTFIRRQTSLLFSQLNPALDSCLVCGVKPCTCVLHMGPIAEHLTDGFSLWKIMFCPIVQFHITICASPCKAETVKVRDLLEKSERATQKKSSFECFNEILYMPTSQEICEKDLKMLLNLIW